MIVNAKLLRADAPAAPTTGGEEQWTNGSAISVDCAIDDPNFVQRRLIDQLELDATAVMYVPMSAGVPITEGMRMLVQQTGLAAVTYAVRSAKPRVHGAQSHYEAFVRAVA